MNALIAVFPLYFLLFMIIGRKSFKHFLIFTAIASLPLEITYSIISELPRDGWATGVQLSLSELSCIILLIYLLKNQHNFKASKKIMLPILLFLLVCAVSVINSTTMRFTFYQVIMIGKLFFLYCYVLSNAIESEQDVNIVLNAFTVSLIFQGSIAILQCITGYSFDIFTTGNREHILMSVLNDNGLVRVQGTVPHPNGFSLYIVPLILLNISLAVGIKTGRALRLVSISCGLFSLLFSFSRGGWVGLTIGLIVYCYYAFQNDWLKPRHIVITLIILLLFSPVIFMRNFSNDNNAAMSRLPLITLAYNMIRSHPLIGIGANTFSSEIRHYITPELEGLYMDQVHNMYILIFAEVGILGLAAFLWLLIAIARQSIALLKNGSHPYIMYIGLGIALGIADSSTHMMFNMFNGRLTISALFIQAGLIMSLQNLSAKTPNVGAQSQGFRPTTQFVDRGVRKPTPLYEYWKSRSKLS
jgi:putative inorganic carbon (hco3(-)) transporter